MIRVMLRSFQQSGFGFQKGHEEPLRMRRAQKEMQITKYRGAWPCAGGPLCMITSTVSREMG